MFYYAFEGVVKSVTKRSKVYSLWSIACTPHLHLSQSFLYFAPEPQYNKPMAYYIKTIGLKGPKKASIFEGRFPRMLLSQMLFKSQKGKTRRLRKGDKLVLYCVSGGIREFPRGAFIGSQEVLGVVKREMELFDEPWSHVVDIRPEAFSLRSPITVKDVKKWPRKSEKLNTAMKAALQAVGGLWEIEKEDYRQFVKAFTGRTSGAV